MARIAISVAGQSKGIMQTSKQHKRLSDNALSVKRPRPRPPNASRGKTMPLHIHPSMMQPPGTNDLPVPGSSNKCNQISREEMVVDETIINPHVGDPVGLFGIEQILLEVYDPNSPNFSHRKYLVDWKVSEMSTEHQKCDALVREFHQVEAVDGNPFLSNCHSWQRIGQALQWLCTPEPVGEMNNDVNGFDVEKVVGRVSTCIYMVRWWPSWVTADYIEKNTHYDNYSKLIPTYRETPIKLNVYDKLLVYMRKWEKDFGHRVRSDRDYPWWYPYTYKRNFLDKGIDIVVRPKSDRDFTSTTDAAL